MLDATRSLKGAPLRSRGKNTEFRMGCVSKTPVLLYIWTVVHQIAIFGSKTDHINFGDPVRS
jgi:hypothetical protein